jgi:predicted DNA-binding protein (MmcQ/YjbR family)
MNIEDLQQFCLSLPEVEETLPFGPDTLVFKVQGKVFLLAGLDQSPVSFNVKCDPEKAIELREAYPAVQPGYHMNKKHWNTVTADGSIPASLLKEWIRESYELVKPRAKKKKQ